MEGGTKVLNDDMRKNPVNVAIDGDALEQERKARCRQEEWLKKKELE